MYKIITTWLIINRKNGPIKGNRVRRSESWSVLLLDDASACYWPSVSSIESSLFTVPSPGLKLAQASLLIFILSPIFLVFQSFKNPLEIILSEAPRKTETENSKFFYPIFRPKFSIDFFRENFLRELFRRKYDSYSTATTAAPDNTRGRAKTALCNFAIATRKLRIATLVHFNCYYVNFLFKLRSRIVHWFHLRWFLSKFLPKTSRLKIFRFEFLIFEPKLSQWPKKWFLRSVRNFQKASSFECPNVSAISFFPIVEFETFCRNAYRSLIKLAKLRSYLNRLKVGSFTWPFSWPILKEFWKFMMFKNYEIKLKFEVSVKTNGSTLNLGQKYILRSFRAFAMQNLLLAENFETIPFFDEIMNLKQCYVDLWL